MGLAAPRPNNVSGQEHIRSTSGREREEEEKERRKRKRKRRHEMS
jgi:hypothetical protein